MPLIFSLFSTAQCTISSVSYFLYKATISYWGIVGETGSSGALLEGFAWEHFSLTSPQCQWTHFHGRRVWITVNSAVILSQSNSQKNRIKSNHNFQWNLVFCNMTGCPPKSWWLMIPAKTCTNCTELKEATNMMTYNSIFPFLYQNIWHFTVIVRVSPLWKTKQGFEIFPRENLLDFLLHIAHLWPHKVWLGFRLNGQQGATPLTSKSLFVCKLMRQWPFFSLDSLPQ